MSALIKVSDLNYNTDTGTISSVGIIIDSRSFRIVLEGNKYIVTNNGETLGNTDENLKAPDKNSAVMPVVEEVKTVTPVVEVKTVKPRVKTGAKAVAKTETETETGAKAVAKTGTETGANSFKNNDELIKILNGRDFKSTSSN